MAEDDDDEAFGDFAFASFQSTNSLSNGLNPSAVADEEDDDWGDFVQTPPQTKASEAPFKGNHQSGNSGSPTTWLKPSGAIPLSIFGDDADEEAEVSNSDVAADLDQGISNGITSDIKVSKVDNGLSSSHGFSITDLYDQYSQMMPENREGFESTGNFDLVENGGSNQNGSISAVTELSNDESKGTPGKGDLNQLTNKSENEEFSFESYVPNPSNKENLFGGWTQEFNGFSLNLDVAPQNVQTSSSGSDLNAQKKELDGSAASIDFEDEDDDGWEFKDAYSEFGVQEVKNNVGFTTAHEVSERRASPSGSGIDSNKPIDLFETSNGLIDFFEKSPEPVDYFANSNSISSSFQEVDLIGIQPNMATPNGFMLDTHSIIEQNNKGQSNPQTDVYIEDIDDDFGEFTVAPAESGASPAELSTNDDNSVLKNTTSTPDGKIQEKEMKSNHHRGAIPLSIFGSEEPESGDSSDLQDEFMHQSSFEQRNNHTPAKTISINDLISNLYSHAAQTSSVISAENHNDTLLNLSSAVSSSNVVNDDDEGDDDSSWDFKDASQMRADSEASLSNMEDKNMNISVKLKLNNYLDFYSKLKEVLYFVAKRHIEILKQVQSNAALGVGAEATPLDSEFQMVYYAELEQMSFVSEESVLHPPGDYSLNEFAQVLQEPLFRRLESEYHLSHQLLLVEKDLGSAMELIRHTNAMLQILTAGTLEEQKMYVSLWSKMISACTQELKHGSSIWNKAMEKHVQIQLLYEPQGRKFLLALGEIYRVVVILSASAKLFKPWILSGSVDSLDIYNLREECHAIWSNSGLQKAFSTTLDDASLIKSIQHILGLDAVKIHHYVFTEKESRCNLSMLTSAVVPELKMILWGNETCFVTLANLCANLISCDPPKLPHINLG